MNLTNREKWLTKFSRRRNLLTRETLINLFTITTYPHMERQVLIGKEKPIIDKVYSGVILDVADSWNVDTKHVLLQDEEYIYGLEIGTESYSVVCLQQVGNPIFGIYDQMNLVPDAIENYSGSGEYTTFGRYLTNYFALASVFGNIIPYVNDIYNIGKMESVIGQKALLNEVTAEQLSTYLNHMFFLGSFSELAVPVYSKKSLTTDPNIKKRKEELLKQHADKLDDPVICTQIEDELIRMDKDWLKGDPAMGFYGASGKKFNVHRKRQFLAVGLVDEFSKEKGKYDFISGALCDGWEKDAFPALCNEIRRGSYSRGIETAQGGVQTKYLLRLFQNTVISAENCGTKRGLTVTFTDSNIKDFYGCNIILSSGKLETLTSRNASKFNGTTVKIRSVMYCEEKNGFCFTCAGDTYRNLDIKAIGATALEMGAAFLTMSMKSMHGTKLSSFTVDNLDQYLV